MYMHVIPFDLTMPRHETIVCPEGMTHKQYLAITVEHTKPWHEGCKHVFEAPSRMGETHCGLCGAPAWSAQWVRPGVMGGDHATDEWVMMLARHYDSLVSVDLLREKLGATVIAEIPMPEPEPKRVTVVLAALEPSEPARRPGLSVPQMQRGVLS